MLAAEILFIWTQANSITKPRGAINFPFDYLFDCIAKLREFFSLCFCKRVKQFASGDFFIHGGESMAFFGALSSFNQ